MIVVPVRNTYFGLRLHYSGVTTPTPQCVFFVISSSYVYAQSLCVVYWSSPHSKFPQLHVLVVCSAVCFAAVLMYIVSQLRLCPMAVVGFPSFSDLLPDLKLQPVSPLS